jgi:hypothetical protein
MGKARRVLGIIMALLTILPFVMVAALYNGALAEVDMENWQPGDPHPESVAVARWFFGYFVICAVISAVGVAGSLLPGTKRRLGGKMMSVSGIVVALIGFPWYFKFAPIFLAIAGSSLRAQGDDFSEEEALAGGGTPAEAKRMKLAALGRVLGCVGAALVLLTEVVCVGIWLEKGLPWGETEILALLYGVALGGAALAGALLARGRPRPAARLLLTSGAIALMLLTAHWIFAVLSLLLIGAGVLLMLSARGAHGELVEKRLREDAVPLEEDEETYLE